MRTKVERTWMSRGESCRRICEQLKSSRESRKNLDEQRRKLQKDLRKVEKLSCVPKEAQDGLMNDLQQPLQEVEQRRHEHQKVQKRSQKIQSIQDKRRHMQKECAAAQAEMRKIREEIVDRNEERFRQLSDKADKNKMVDAEIAVELQGVQARRGSNASQAVDCCLETTVKQFFVMGTDQARSKFDAVCQVFCKKFENLQPFCTDARKRTNKSKAKPVSSWRCQRQAGAMKVLQRIAWSLLFLVFGVHLADNERTRPLSNSPSRPSMEEDALL